MDNAPQRDTLLILFVTMFPQTVASMVCMAPPVMAAQISESLGLPAEMTGAYIGLLYICVIATSSGSTYLISRIGPLRTSLGCVVLGGIGLVLFAMGNLIAALLATMILGLSYGPLTPASSYVIADHRGSSALAFIVSVRQTSVPMGGVLAGAIVPSLVLGIGWKGTCVVLGLATALIGIVVGLCIPLVRRESAPRFAAEGSSMLAAIRFVVQRPKVFALAGTSLVYGAMQVILSSFLVVYLTTAADLDLVTAGALLGASQVAGVLGRLLWGFIADRMATPRRLLLLIGVLIAVASALTGFFSPGWPIALIGIVVILFGATASGWNGVYLAEIMREVGPAQIGLVTGGSLILTYTGVMIGPPLFGAIAAFMGFAGAFMVMAAIVIAGAALASANDLFARPGAVR
jgi:MFS family permease